MDQSTCFLNVAKAKETKPLPPFSASTFFFNTTLLSTRLMGIGNPTKDGKVATINTHLHRTPKNETCCYSSKLPFHPRERNPYNVCASGLLSSVDTPEKKEARGFAKKYVRRGLESPLELLLVVPLANTCNCAWRLVASTKHKIFLQLLDPFPERFDFMYRVLCPGENLLGHFHDCTCRQTDPRTDVEGCED